MSPEIQKGSVEFSSISTRRPAQISIVVIVLLIVVIGLFSWFILRPKRAELSAKQGTLSKLETEENQLSENLAKLKALVVELKDSPGKTAKLDEALPLSDDTPRPDMLLEQLARSTGVTVGDINIISENDAVIAGNTKLLEKPFDVSRGLKIMEGALQVTGNYQQLKSFLQKLETSARLIDTTALTLSGTDKGLLNLSLNFRMYYFGPQNLSLKKNGNK